ncbi:HAD-IA family hydrolase [Roseospira navarrensis]|uniref:HAD-IA family hydrolase n=1 Tax=Roseospira navarrensis TaxID=140058 RepID=A0A7X2D363_9PROT|nr:HAD-IA family hydrolase [Roseospira navarrensis]MQX36999.1 HAD-IA family hydrolase [Roseospira navarrensis]
MTTLCLAVFDVDGTLVDSQHNIVAAMAMACQAAGVTVPSDDATRAIIGLSLDEAVAAVTPSATPDQQARVADLYKQAFVSLRARPDHDEPLFPGVHAMLDRLEADGVLLGIATGKSRRGVDVALERHGLDGRFLSIQTADDGPGKPHPGMLLRAMASLGTDPAGTVMIGDTTFDMQMARAARTDAIGVAWGYHPAAALLGAGARVVAADCDAVPLHVGGARAVAAS